MRATTKRLEYFIPFVILLFSVFLQWQVVGQGALSMGDERRYLSVFKAVSEISEQLNSHSFFGLLSAINQDTHGRPAAGVVWVLQSFFHQAFAAFYQIDPLSPAGLLGGQIFNILISASAAIAFFWWMLRLSGAVCTASLALVLYVCLPSQLLFIRHFLPYTLSLFWSFLALGCVSGIKPDWAAKRIRNIGALIGIYAALGFSSYPGFYCMPFVTAALFWTSTSSTQRLPAAVGFLSGAFLVLLSFEVLSFISHAQFSDQLHALSSTVTQGSYAEGLLFPFRYLVTAEGLLGVVLLVGTLLCIVSTKSLPKSSQVLLRVTLAAIALHALLTFVAHYFVFYGRLLLCYLPLLLAVIALRVQHFSQKRLSSFLLIGIAVISAALALQALRSVTYPRDVLYSKVLSQKTERVSTVSVCQNVRQGFMPLENLQAIENKAASEVLVNFCFFYPVQNLSEIRIPSGAHRLFSAPHFLSYWPYLLETFSPEERAILNAKPLNIEIWKLPPASIPQ